jgi:hypothetical protein
LPKEKDHTGYWVLAITIILLLYLLFESLQRSQKIEEVLKQTPLELKK